MLKTDALELLGGDTSSAAKAIGIEYQAVDKWPEQLSPRIADRVVAAVAKQGNRAALKKALELAEQARKVPEA